MYIVPLVDITAFQDDLYSVGYVCVKSSRLIVQIPENNSAVRMKNESLHGIIKMLRDNFCYLSGQDCCTQL